MLLMPALAMLAPGVALSQMAPTIEPGTTINLSYDFYPVVGRDATEVLHSLKRNGPRTNGETFFGLTKSQTGFAYQLASDKSGCRVESFGVKTQIIVSLPKWDPPHNVAPELVSQWEAFLVKLEEHEMWHAEASSHGTEEIYRLVKDLAGETCREVDRRAKREVARISEDIERRNEEYDRVTDHGRKSGIVWHY